MCNIRRGDKPYVVTWHLKGDIVSSDPDLTTTMLGTQASLLTINNVGFRHSGTYTCRAENSAGVSTYSAQLKVNGKHTSGEGTGNITYFMFWWGIDELKGTQYHALCLLSRKFVWQSSQSAERRLQLIYCLTIMFLCSELPEIGAFSFAKEVISEGDSAQNSCIVTPGDQPLTISWSFHRQTGWVRPGRADNGISTANLVSRSHLVHFNKFIPF